MRAWPGGIGGATTELLVGCWASAFTAANRTSAAAANDDRRGTIFRFVGMLPFHFRWFARVRVFAQIPTGTASVEIEHARGIVQIGRTRDQYLVRVNQRTIK